jgi:aryl-alcohol dehydrogenase-like predicted oxidoreductase
MEKIELATTGRQTTRLGFGCSSLMGATNRRDSLRLLETAYEAGIRHFDVAPMYGYGHAEACLGEFLERHPGQLTVTTKFGIAPPKHSGLLRVARRIAGPIVNQLPGMKRKLAQAASAATRPTEQPRFNAAEAKASLNRSLRALRTDHIDLWLLHEAEAHDLTDDSLLALLESEVEQGTIGSFGVGSTRNSIPALLAERPAYCRTLQYEWSILDALIPATQPFRIHHRALTDKFRALHRALAADKTLCRRWSDSTNTDLNNAEALANLMLKAARVMNPSSIILVSSKNPHHIHANARVAADPALEAPARHLYTLIQSEPNLIRNLQA